jgi:hypothetical protein
MYVDAKDSVGKWWVGQIIEIDEDKNWARVHYDGWSEKYDEIINLSSDKIAPFRFITNGYTGQRLSAYRDFHFNEVLHKKFVKELEEIWINGFEVLETPRKVTQYIRGELYFYVDSMLSLFLNTSVAELSIYYQFMSHVFNIIQLWMKHFPSKLYKNYNLSRKHTKLYLIDFDTAVARCGDEFIDILAKCFGCCSRWNELYRHFMNAYFYKGEYEAIPYSEGKSLGFMCSLMNMFCDLRGFESFRQFFVVGHPQLGNSVIPLNLMNKLLHSLKPLYLRVNSTLATEVLEIVK